MQKVLLLVMMVMLANCGGGGGSKNAAEAPSNPEEGGDLNTNREDEKVTLDEGSTEETEVPREGEAGDEEDEDDTSIDSEPLPEEKLVFQDIVNTLLVPSRCVSCHVADYQWVKNRVTVGDADNSSIVRMIESGAMPMGGPRVKPEVVAQLKQWINEGANHE